MKSKTPNLINGSKVIESTSLEPVKSIESIPFATTNSTELLLNMLMEAKVDLDADLPEVQECLAINQDGKHITIGTLGNFTLIKGKAKSRKTFLASIFTAAALMERPLQNLLQGSLPSDQRLVLTFDTEQSDYHVSLSAKRVLKLTGLEECKSYLVYKLREHTPKRRLKLIELGIKQNPETGIVIIDGLRDLVTAINDEQQATRIIGKILSWTKKYNIHIIGILHENKQNLDPRGHIGTEAQNKAETVITVTTSSSGNPKVSIVKAAYCRNNEFAPFAFKIDDDGLPHIIPDWKEPIRANPRQKASNPEQIPFKDHKVMLDKVFRQKKFLRSGELLIKLKQVAISSRLNLSNLKTRDFIKYYCENELIQFEGTPGTKHCLYFLPI